MFVQAVPPPAAGVVSGPSTGYAPFTGTYSTTGSNGALQWYARVQPNTAWTLLPGGTNNPQNITFSGVGNYEVMVVATVAGCTPDTAAFASTSITIQNDNVCDAVPLNIGANGPFSNIGATTEVGEATPPGGSCNSQTSWCSGQTISNTIWFSFVAPPSGKIAIRTLAPLWDNQLAVWSAEDCGGLLSGAGTLLAANDDSSSSPYHSYISPLCVTPGQTYYVQLDGYGGGTSGNINLELIDAGNTAPVVSNCPSTVYVATACDAANATATWSEPTVTDDCGTPSSTASHNPGDVFPIGTTTVTYTYDDGFNPAVTCSFDVVVEARTSSTGSESQTACDNYTWPTNGQNYTSTGVYTHTLVGANAQGCDSTVTLNLTINPLPTVTASDVSACAGNSVALIGNPSGGSFSVANPYSGPTTTYTYTYTDANGCTNTSAPANIFMTAAPPVTGINISNIGGNSATVNWNSIPGLVWYEVRYRAVGAGSWTGGGTQAAPTTFKNIVGLTAGTQYEVEVRGFCSTPNFPGPWSSTTIFTTSNACVAPSNLAEINVTGTSATVTWTAVPNTNYYQVRYRLAAGPGAWVNGTAPGSATSKNYTGLALNTSYEWQIRAICNPSPFTTGPWSAIGDWTTLASKPSVEELVAMQNEIMVYPNPATSVVMVDPTAIDAQQTVVKLFDISGRLVKQLQARHEAGSHTMTIGLEELTSGMYTIQVYCNDALKHTSKISKQD
ncbi:MAG: fibronectin type III domain-containing protein [Bacteroidota bacterium]|nr:MAG: fibronectin type III domain-containing protein [Bacteroidota bacterium]